MDGGSSNDPFHTVLARAVLIGDDGELDTGVCYDDRYTQAFSASDIPTGSLRVELRPAPEMRWMFASEGPILGDVIRIDSIERVEVDETDFRRLKLSQF